MRHDTNLANLNKLLDLAWRLNDLRLPDDTRNLPDNDSLPAGALVFALRGKPGHHTHQYVTQSLGEIGNAPPAGL